MPNIIAVIWDCDKTLIDGYMQDPIFNKYGVDGASFWKEVNHEVQKLKKSGQRVNSDIFAINYIAKCAQSGRFSGLNNAMLKKVGRDQHFYPGIPDFFERSSKALAANPEYAAHGIKLEHYVISTGFAEIIRGSALMPFLTDVWGCELLDKTVDGNKVLGDIIYSVDNTAKTRALFEINKGSETPEGVDVNSAIAKELRRVKFENMIYIADGPSDIPAFSLIKQNGGATFAIYPRGDMRALKQVESLRRDGRVDMYAEADYTENSTASMWIINKINEKAEAILKKEIEQIQSGASQPPMHLT